ncbi:MAG: hypothetical protein ACTSP5_12425 [Candidatus Heimdallarchaeota archaeon]
MEREKKSSFKNFLQESSLLLLSTLPVMVGSTISPGLSTIAGEFVSIDNFVYWLFVR